MNAIFSDDDWMQLAKVMTREMEPDRKSVALMAIDPLTASIVQHLRGRQENPSATVEFNNLLERIQPDIRS